MNQNHSEEDDDDFGMPGLPTQQKRVQPISCEIESRPISRNADSKNTNSLPPVSTPDSRKQMFMESMSGFLDKEEGKTDKKLSEELKEDVLIAGDDFADFVDKEQ